MPNSAPLEKYPPGLVFKWLLLPFMAGSINAGGFMACKRLVTHVTGFATYTGIEVADANWRGAAGMLSVPFYFLVGVIIGAYFTDAKIAKGRKPRFGLVLNLVAVLLLVAAIAGYFDWFGYFGGTFVLEADYALLVLLCGASGMLNSTITASSRGLLRATHLTGTTTDIGVTLARIYFGHGHGNRRARDVYHNWLRVGTVTAFIAGSVVGAVLFTLTQYLGFCLPCALALYVGNLGDRVGAASLAAASVPLATPVPPVTAVSGAAPAGGGTQAQQAEAARRQGP